MPITADAGGRHRRRAAAARHRRIFRLAVTSSSEWTADERKRLYVIGVLFLAAALFWSVFEQAGSTLNLFADRNTHNDVFGAAVSEQLVPVDELVLPDPVRAGDGVGVGQDGGGGQRAVGADEVRVGPGVRRRWAS